MCFHLLYTLWKIHFTKDKTIISKITEIVCAVSLLRKNHFNSFVDQWLNYNDYIKYIPYLL